MGTTCINFLEKPVKVWGGGGGGEGGWRGWKQNRLWKFAMENRTWFESAVLGEYTFLACIFCYPILDHVMVL